MGGGATHIDLPVIKCKTSSSSIPPTTLSPSSSSSLNFPVSTNITSPLTLPQSSCSCYCPSESAIQHKTQSGSLCTDVFGPVPSQFEVQNAITALLNYMQGASSYSSGLLQVLDGYERAEDAFRLLQTDPIMKRLVVSLSSDKAVWNAIMNNEMLKQLQGSRINSAENCRIQSCDQEMDVVTCMLNWMMEMSKAKVTQLIQKFQSLMNEIFQPPKMEREREKEKPAEESREEDDRIGSSLLLSLVIILIVVVARVYKA